MVLPLLPCHDIWTYRKIGMNYCDAVSSSLTHMRPRVSRNLTVDLSQVPVWLARPLHSLGSNGDPVPQNFVSQGLWSLVCVLSMTCISWLSSVNSTVPKSVQSDTWCGIRKLLQAVDRRRRLQARPSNITQH